MNLTAAAARLREDERLARESLDRGCSADVASLDRLLDGPLRQARAELEAEIASLGTPDATLRRNLLVQLAEDVAMRCAGNAFANASVRFRARFGIYAGALSNAEQRFVAAARKAAAANTLQLQAERRIMVPHIELNDELAVIPRCEVSFDTVEQWLIELEARLRRALEEAVERARLRVVRRGTMSLSRTRVALRLAAHGHDLVL